MRIANFGILLSEQQQLRRKTPSVCLFPSVFVRFCTRGLGLRAKRFPRSANARTWPRPIGFLSVKADLEAAREAKYVEIERLKGLNAFHEPRRTLIRSPGSA